MTSTSDAAAAQELKDKGNEAFKKHDWLPAIDFYTQAIKKDGAQAAYYSNRAQVGLFEAPGVIVINRRVQVNIKLEAYGYAIADATKAIELDSSFIKV